MQGSKLPLVVAHGEGRASYQHQQQDHVAVRYIDNYGNTTEQYPFNPNGSPNGVASVVSADGRVTLMMPHPERIFRSIQLSWCPDTWSEDSPWMQMFYNAFEFTDAAIPNIPTLIQS